MRNPKDACSQQKAAASPYQQNALIDPVPELAISDYYGEAQQSCHDLEAEVYRLIGKLDGLQIASLHVHRTATGVCLSGQMTAKTSNAVDQIEEVIKHVGLDHFVNRIVTQCEETSLTHAER